MGKSNRIRANRSQAKISAPVKAKKKQGVPTWLMSVIAIAVAVVVLFTVVGGVLSANGVILRLRKGISSENFEISGTMMSYFYHVSYENFKTNYSSYLSYLSLDTSKSLKDQIYGDASLGGYETSYLGEFEGTWYDYFMNMAVESAKQVLTYCEEAKARNISLDDADRASIAIELETIKITASAMSASPSQYLSYMYGQGVKISDVEKVLELTTLASKAMAAVQEEILDGISDPDIVEAYNSAKDEFDLVDYIYYSFSANYESIAKEMLGSDYTADELNAKKDEVDAKYNEKVEEAKKYSAELAAITDKDEFMKYILTYIAGLHYDTEYAKAELETADIPSEEILAAVKAACVEAVVKEVMEGKTETASDVVKADDKYTIYEQSVTKAYAEAVETVKKAVFTSVTSAKSSYTVEKSGYASTNEFSKWAFESGRTVGELKTITNDEKPEESYSSAVYMLTKTRYADDTKTKNIAYMLFSTKDAAKAAIEALKAKELSLETFESSATDLSATTVSTIEEYIEGYLGIDAFDAWAYSDDIKLGDLTAEPIEIEADSSYLVGYYYEEGDVTWKVTVKSDIFNDRYTESYEALLAKYAPAENDRTLNKVSDGYLPAGLLASAS